MLVLKNPTRNTNELAFARKALERGELVIVPTDTVYGIAALANNQEAVQRLNSVKNRPANQPIAVIFASVQAVREVFEDSLSDRALWAITALLPGPWTLVVQNPGRIWPWLGGGGDTIGLRVPAGALDLPAHAATSANPTGMPVAARISELDSALVEVCACAIDLGPRDAKVTGGSSTVIDLTDWEQGGDLRVIRDDIGRIGQAENVFAAAPPV